MHVGEYTYGLPKVFMWTAKHHVYIGKFCSIADGVEIIADGNHRMDWVSTYPFGRLVPGIPPNDGHPAGGDIVIGNDVWIGRGALILPGVTIGDGAVIGAGAIVAGAVGDYEVVAGNPARHIRYRFTEKQIEALKKIRWWDWPIDRIAASVGLIESPDIDGFIAANAGLTDF